MGHRMAAALQGGSHGPSLVYLKLWVGIVASAVVGVLAFDGIGLGAIWPAAVWTLLLTIVAIPIEAS